MAARRIVSSLIFITINEPRGAAHCARAVQAMRQIHNMEYLSGAAGARVLDSITKLTPDDAGRVVIAGSHGGRYAAYCAARGNVLAVILNDAGVGWEQAGIAGLA